MLESRGRHHDEGGNTVQATGEPRKSYQCGVCGAKGGNIHDHACPYAYPGDLSVIDIWRWQGGVIEPGEPRENGPPQHMSRDELLAGVRAAKVSLQRTRMAIDDMQELLNRPIEEEVPCA